jgi:hypothetical protein
MWRGKTQRLMAFCGGAAWHFKSALAKCAALLYRRLNF